MIDNLNGRIDVIFGLLIPVIYLVAIRFLPSSLTGTNQQIIFREIIIVLITSVMMYYSIYIIKVPVNQLGITPFTSVDFVLGLAAAFIIIAATLVFALALGKVGITFNSGTIMGALSNQPLWLLLLIVAVAAVSEEMVFRSLTITWIKGSTGSIFFGIAYSTLAFAAGHLHIYGPGKVLLTLIPGVLFAILFVFRGNIFTCIFAHIIIDIVGITPIIMSKF